MKPALDRNTIKTAIRGAYEIDAWARGEPIDAHEFDEQGRRIGRESIWRLAFDEGSTGRINSINLYTLDAFELIIERFDFGTHTGSAYPASDALVSMLTYNTGDDSAPTPHVRTATYEGDMRIGLNRPQHPEIIERQHDLLDHMRTKPGTEGSIERARAAYQWIRETL